MSAITANALSSIAAAVSRALAPKRTLTVSEWADENRVLSQKQSQRPGEWRTSANPPLREPMDCFSALSPVQDVVCEFCIQFGKSEIETNVVGYTMCEVGGPIMVCLPGEVTMNKWIDQKLNPMIEETEAVRRVLSSTASRDAANRRTFKDFEGGQLYIEHAGNPDRLKATSVSLLVLDEYSSLVLALKSGDDPDAMLDGRTSGFPATYRRLKVGSPGIKGVCRVDQLYQKSDQRRFYVPCPDCGHEQPLEWSGLHWNPEVTECWYACRECGAVIREHLKTAMIAAGRWVPENPGAAVRGYHINCLYYQIGMGPRWMTLIREWLEAQGDPAKLKTFVNDRLAEAWEDPGMRAVKHSLLADRAEPYRLRVAPNGVLALSAGIDTQDDRLPVQIIGWGRGLASWTIDYVELPGDPNEDAVWLALTELLNRPIQHACGALMRIEAACIDMGGHRTEAVKAFARRRLVRRLLPIMGAVRNNAPVLSKGTMVDINWKGQYDKKGIKMHHVGTVAIKQRLYALLGSDADKPLESRMVHLSDELEPAFFGGLVSEIYNPAKNRFEKRKGAPRNEPLDTYVYGYAATHHPELRLHRHTRADWDAREARLLASVGKTVSDSRGTSEGDPVATGPWPTTVRMALDEIVVQYERHPMDEPQPQDLQRWSAADSGSADERAVLGAILDQIRDGRQPLVALLPRGLVDRARALLGHLSAADIRYSPRRSGRGVRHSGVR